MKTIRLSKNLFSLTERLPKNKYAPRNRSNDLRRDVSQDSIINQPAVKIVPLENNNSFKIKQNEREVSGGKASRDSDEGIH
jgi:hypothetical protein